MSLRKRKSTEPYLATYLHTKGRKLGLPISGNFELTARCNFNCPMCYVHMSEKEVEACGKELTTQQWIEIAEAAKNKGMVFALLTGGEPFVRKDFFEIYGAMKKMGIVVSINSNGSMLEGRILEQLLADPPARINISLYGGCNETYQNMCGLSAYEKVLKNIVTLKEHGVDVRINLSITPYNYQDIEKIYEITKHYEIPVRASSYMYPPARLNKQPGEYGERFSPEESAKWSVAWDRLRFTKEEFSQRAKAMQNFMKVEEEKCSVDMEAGVRCRAGSSSFWMTWDGQMRPCGMMPFPTAYPLEVGFETAWEQIRQATAQIRQPEKCVGCPKKEICGACAAVCVAETGEFSSVPEYMCERADKLIELNCAQCQEHDRKVNESCFGIQG